jgi:APA family basic amino acid/polyamine antiporter
MIVMGGIVGAGIFANPSEVAHRVHTPFLILGVWVLGGCIAMCGAFIWAELATRLPAAAGGQYVYLREAYHPAVAFMYGWGLLLVTQTGGMAAVAVIFASYFRVLTGAEWNESAIAAIALLALTGINCLGARAGSNVQSALMLLKIGAIAALVTFGLAVGHNSLKSEALLGSPASFGLLKSIGAAMVPVAFAYGGWQTATFVAGEMRDGRRDLSRGLLIGVGGVVALYLAVNLACLLVLGSAGLDATTTPASDVMRIALGERGAQWIAIAISISTLGFLSQGMLTAPRVYYAMARDGVFFAAAARVHPRFKTPAMSIVAQAAWTTLLILTGAADALANYTGFAITLFAGAAVAAVFVLRSREPTASRPFKALGYPWTPALFVAVSVVMVVNALYRDPATAGLGALVILAGVPLYFYFRRNLRAE